MRTVLYHGSSIDPTHQAHTLDPTPEVPFPITHVPIRLLLIEEVDHILGKFRQKKSFNGQIYQPAKLFPDPLLSPLRLIIESSLRAST